MRLQPPGSLEERRRGGPAGAFKEVWRTEIRIDPSFTLHFDVQTPKLSLEQTLTLTPERLSFTRYLIINVISGFLCVLGKKVTLKHFSDLA